MDGLYLIDNAMGPHSPHDAYDPNVREYHLDALPVKLLEHTK